MICEVQSRNTHVFLGSDHRVLGGSGVRGDGETVSISRNRRFELAGSSSRTQAVMENRCGNSNYDAHNRDTDH
jgi:hypothetical protein